MPISRPCADRSVEPVRRATPLRESILLWALCGLFFLRVRGHQSLARSSPSESIDRTATLRARLTRLCVLLAGRGEKAIWRHATDGLAEETREEERDADAMAIERGLLEEERDELGWASSAGELLCSRLCGSSNFRVGMQGIRDKLLQMTDLETKQEAVPRSAHAEQVLHAVVAA